MDPMSKYEYKCMTCDHIYWFNHGQTYKNCTKCEDRGELRLKSIQHDDDDDEPVDDSPEITGIPDGDKLSDTDDEFDADVEMQEMKTEKIIEERDEEDEPEMPEGGWECSECGASVDNMNDVCSRSCFNAMMR